jgi:Tol biopolymer transport system component
MLAAGTTLGPYKILAPLGAGGMGEVYRAHDTRLGRDVAIKVLSPHLAPTPEVRARFEREARTISQLNHPHICTLHDVGHQDGTDYLVMELVEGETVAHRLEKGPLPVVEVLALGVQIADALDRAHRAGVVHRDLKPGNVMLTKAGAKLMDFGLARAAALTPAPGALTESPTVSRPLTAEGTIVGTFQYMAPEQLEGKEADARADIWALGCVLYEMATGQRAFGGKSQASLISAIMKDEPRPVSELQPMSPPALEHLVRRCLAKDPDKRWQSAGDLARELEWVAAGGSQTGAPLASAAGRGARGRGRERLLWSTALLVVVLAALAIFIVPRLLPHGPRQAVSRFSITAPENVTLVPDAAASAISPDGRTLAFVAVDSAGTSRIWVRPLDSLAPRELIGTENGALPFWSPDSRFIGFFADGRLKKILAAGGSPEVLCDVRDGRGGSWSRDGVIVFAPDPAGPLFRVPASGGTPIQVTSLDSTRHETGHRWPCFLPDGRHFLFVALPHRQGNYDAYAGSLDSRDRRFVISAGAAPTYAAPGYLLYVRNASIVAQRFDARRLSFSGEPVTVGEAPTPSGYDASPRVTTSDDGVIAHFGVALPNTELKWFDRLGHPAGTIPVPPGRYEGARLSPDGKRLCLERRSSATAVDLWLLDLDRPVPTRFTFGPSINQNGVWSPDGSRIAFNSNRAGPLDIYVKPAGGAGEEQPLLISSGLFKQLSQWSPDGRFLVYHEPQPRTGWDLWLLPTEGDHKPVPYLRTAFNEYLGTVSPDSRWMAYFSDESGKLELYVQSFPTPGSKYQVSTNGAGGQLNYSSWWARDGRELIYAGEDGFTLMAVDVQTSPTFKAGAPHKLFKLRGDCLWVDITRDGQRVLVTVPAGQASASTITLEMNWTAAVRKP